VKGIVLAGGTGSRLFPLTKITNKHLLPIYDKPMIFYPIQALVDAGIRDILLVTGGRNLGDFLRLLANGKEIRAGSSELHLPGRRGRHRRRADSGRTLRRRRENLRDPGR
jgi:dTDP-glucose pyrophosphorylase